MRILRPASWLPLTVICMVVAAPVVARPNFVFIITDDQRWDALSIVQKELGERGRFPWLRTPNMDRIALEGVRFRNAFVVNSLCSPARASFLCGTYGHVNGIVNNHTPFDPKTVTYASLLRDAGYTTGYVGKWHMGPQAGKRPGFSFSASFVGQGKYMDCPFDVNGKAQPTSGFVDDVSTDFALQFLRDNRDRSFALQIGYKSAHGPFSPPPRHQKTYGAAKARRTPNFGLQPIYRQTNAARTGAASNQEWVNTNLGYFRCLTAVDDCIGRLLDALDELGLTDNTMVVFAGDNGFYLGEHALGDKRSAYDESMRIPLLVRYPKLGLRDKVMDEMALNIDLAPTILDYAGLPIPRSMQGRSWCPLFEGRADSWRKAFFYCYFYERHFRTPMVTAVRTERAKLIRYPGHDEWTEIFDLTADPYETHNLANDPTAADLRRQLEEAYDREARAIGFRVPAFADDPKDDMPPPALNTWVLDFTFDKDEGARVVDGSGHHNDGRAVNAALVAGRDGHRARRFDGRGCVEVKPSPSLNPAVGAWTVEATFRTDKLDGVVVAHGGRTNGYCLYLRNGKPTFAVTSANKLTVIRTQTGVASRWVTVTARITRQRQVVIEIDGRVAARGRLGRFIAALPNDALQVGADLQSPVVERNSPPRFTGLIERVRLYSGETTTR